MWHEGPQLEVPVPGFQSAAHTIASSIRSPIRAVFSFPAFLGCALILVTVLTARERFDDPDMWWHLKVGEIVWNTHTIPRTDIFSWTTNNHAWLPHEWLAQLFIYAAY